MLLLPQNLGGVKVQVQVFWLSFVIIAIVDLNDMHALAGDMEGSAIVKGDNAFVV